MNKQQKIDINEATKEDLTKIPGIGDATADAIIQFRDERGRINDINELEEAEQISEQNLDSLREWLTVGPEGEKEEEWEAESSEEAESSDLE